ncbi:MULTISPECIES: hypothetical protein [Haloferax]|uniref:Sulfatase-like hydrolase/transferase n=2 Tax=Haloferax TaxID=2251 RepID=A0A6G1Z3L9_9EURY|nr:MULTISPECIES: hypothetical protein [Haloferax]KAB1188439.1 hypothetical protein Hfx1149_10510 [Haloferax sp. CBA1149]MRW81132.1 hypothetical protein [Haloferax marinisediminis]
MATSLRKWISEHYEQIRDDPVRGALHAAYTTYLGTWYTLSSRVPVGTNVFDEDWDVLVILDACRPDVLKDVADEYEFIDDVETKWSVGSHSHEWMVQTFRTKYAEQIGNTAYISGNGHTHETFVDREFPPDESVPFCWPKWDVVDESAFFELDMVWERAHQGKLGVPPRAITDRTIEVHRESDPDRIIAHYMQPHIPYIAGALAEDREPTEVEAKGWKLLESGEADRDEVWNLYEDTLRLVLDEVELLLENVDADDVCITADHGNAFGEYSFYGHPEGSPLRVIKTVPWVRTSAVDSATHEPSDEYLNETAVDIQDHLKDLGYM